MPTAHRVLADQVVQHYAGVVHDPGGRVTVQASFRKVRKVVVGSLGVRFVAQDPSGHLKLAVTGQGTEVQGAVSVVADGRQSETEDSLLSPLEVQAGHVEVSAQGIGEEEAVLEPPRFVLHPRVGDETVAEFIGHVSESVVAIASNIDGNVGDKSVCVGVLWSEFVPPNARV